ncbi:MAG: hypothetical protein JWM10_4185, partial [Myxococcaceae bacterium]|nr:hypothetical protein [Myxococcaceae bacterium]
RDGAALDARATWPIAAAGAPARMTGAR